MSMELIDALKQLVPSVGRLRRRYINASQSPYTVGLDDTLFGVLTFPSSGNTEVLVPSFAALGWTRNATDPIELVLTFQNDGLGFPSVVSKQTVSGTNDVSIDWRGMDPSGWKQGDPPVSIVTCGVDKWRAM